MMDGHRFDAMTRMLAGGLPRRSAIKALAGTVLVGAATRTAIQTAEADGNLGDFCNDHHPCNSPLVCINTECDHCLESGPCQKGWCCKGYTCDGGQCVSCGSHRGTGVTSEGCKRKKKKKHKKKKH